MPRQAPNPDETCDAREQSACVSHAVPQHRLAQLQRHARERCRERDEGAARAHDGIGCVSHTLGDHDANPPQRRFVAR